VRRLKYLTLEKIDFRIGVKIEKDIDSRKKKNYYGKNYAREVKKWESPGLLFLLFEGRSLA